jgi:Acetyltransferase (GNAT) domain
VVVSPSERPLRVRNYRPGDEHAIAELFRVCFGRDRSLDEWRWRFVDAPVAAHLAVLCDGDRIVGSLSRAGFATFVDHKRAVCRQSGDAMVHPEYRGRNGLALMMEGVAEFSDDLRLHAANEVSAKVGRRRRPLRFETTMPQWVRRQPRFVRPALALLRPRRLRPRPLSDLESDVDALAEASASFAPCIRVRDARYLRWRWLDQPGTDWQLWAVGDLGSGAGGIVVFGVDPRHDPPDRGRVVDLLAPDEATTVALLTVAAEELGRAGCTRVALDYHDPRPWSRRACYRAGFVPRGQGPLLRGGAHEEWTRPWADHPESWYLTRGDTDLC